MEKELTPLTPMEFKFAQTLDNKMWGVWTEKDANDTVRADIYNNIERDKLITSEQIVVGNCETQKAVNNMVASMLNKISQEYEY